MIRRGLYLVMIVALMISLTGCLGEKTKQVQVASLLGNIQQSEEAVGQIYKWFASHPEHLGDNAIKADTLFNGIVSRIRKLQKRGAKFNVDKGYLQDSIVDIEDDYSSLMEILDPVAQDKMRKGTDVRALYFQTKGIVAGLFQEANLLVAQAEDELDEDQFEQLQGIVVKLVDNLGPYMSTRL